MGVSSESVAHFRYAFDVELISQRELRNDNAKIMRRVEAGETFVVTRHGKPVADLVPHQADRPGKQTWAFSTELVARKPARSGWTQQQIREHRTAMNAALDGDERDPWT